MARHETTMRSMSLIGFETTADDFGLNAHNLLEDVGIDPVVLTSNNFHYPYQKYVDLMELAAERAGETNFGLLHAKSLAPNFPVFGPVPFLAKFERNMRTWLLSTIRYLRFHTNALTLEMIDDFDAGTVTGRRYVDPLVRQGRQVAEMEVALATLLSMELRKPERFHLLKVRFPHHSPDDISLHHQILECPVEFNAQHSDMVVDMNMMKQPIGTRWRIAKPAVNLVFRSIVDWDVRGRRDSTAVQVRLMIDTLLATKRCNFEDVAAAMNMHPKALQRKLAEEGETFSGILEMVRENVACRLLIHTKMSVGQIAGFLDYSGSNAFALAFKRWTDMSPTQYRKQSKERSES